MLKWSHYIAAVCKGVFALVCYLRFGHDTNQIISTNLPAGSSIRTWVNVLLIFKALTSYPLPYYAIVEMAEVHLPGIMRAVSKVYNASQQRDMVPLINESEVQKVVKSDFLKKPDFQTKKRISHF